MLRVGELLVEAAVSRWESSWKNGKVLPRTLIACHRILLSCALLLGAGLAPDYSCAANTADLNSYIGPAAAECFTKFRLRIQTGYSHGRRNCPQREAMITQDFPPGQSYQAGLQSVFNPQENAFCFVDGYAGAHENHSVEFSVDPPIAPGTHTVRLSYNQVVQNAPPYDGLEIRWNGATVDFVQVAPSTASCPGFTPGEGFGFTFGQTDDAKIIVPDFCQIPTILEKFSGDNQTGLVGQTLAPIKVRVIRADNIVMAGVPVHFKIIQTTSGFSNGSLSSGTAVTDSNGIASVELTLSTNPGNYQIKAEIMGVDCGSVPVVVFNERGISKAKRPKVKITFDRANFQVSYGQTVELCMKVSPRIPFKAKVVFDSNPSGALVGKFGGTATCPDSSYDSIQVKASPDIQCVASAILLIKVKDTTVVGGTLPATIIIPTSETMTKMAQPIRDCSTVFLVSGTQYDFVDQWLVTEKAASAGLDLTGVSFKEDLTVLSNNCSGVISQLLPVGAKESHSSTLPGEGVSQSNQWIDLIGFCGNAVVSAGETPPLNCTFTRRQAITVGSCFVQNSKQTISFDASGNVSTDRAPE